MSMLASAAGFLIGIIVQQATVCFLPGHTLAVVRPAIISVVGISKGVFIANVTIPIKDSSSLSDRSKLFLGKIILHSDGPRQFSRWKHSEKSFKVWLSTAAAFCGDASLSGKYIGEYLGESNLISWGQSIVLADQFDFEVCRASKILDITG